ncbi:MAG: TRAP transporter small permease subunit [Bacillota bacterium]
MNSLKTILSTIDRFNEMVARIFSWAMFALVLTMAYEVVARYVFNAPTLWSYDLSYFLGSLTLMLGMAYTLRVKGHVSIDIFYSRFSPRVQALLYVIFALLLFFPLWGMMVSVMIPHMMFSWAENEKSWVGTWQPIIYPFKTWITLGAIMLLLQGIAEFIRDLVVLVKGGDRP